MKTKLKRESEVKKKRFRISFIVTGQGSRVWMEEVEVYAKSPKEAIEIAQGKVKEEEIEHPWIKHKLSPFPVNLIK